MRGMSSGVGPNLSSPAIREIALTARIADPKLWSPGSPHLYTARVRLFTDGSGRSTSALVRFGMREFKVAGRRVPPQRQADLPPWLR